MIEWAVDQAVHGNLMVQRPANYLKTGRPAYQPQSMFPLHRLAGGGTVPAQLLLAILAHETNMAEASWHAVPGDTGNPLIGSYYGSYNIDVIDYSKADCGYGISQVTSGMLFTDTVYTYDQKIAIATDYAANIAAGLNILIDKWNQLYTDPAGRSYVNNGTASYIENWFLAVGAYNTGFYPSSAISTNGNWGVGWLNNPANASYEADRDPFLRNSYADAAVPSHWPYPERIMGWAESPQLKGDPATGAYLPPVMHTPDPSGMIMTMRLALPSKAQHYLFCSQNINQCSSSTPTNPCPAVSSACWWHGTASWADCADECGAEDLRYSLGTGEPPLERIYDRACGTFDASNDAYRVAGSSPLIVFDLNNPEQYALGCDMGTPHEGKFTMRMGNPSGTGDVVYTPVDLHQVGSGYKGHSGSHTYTPLRRRRSVRSSRRGRRISSPFRK